jgi:thiamine-phosphate diphosphorylase
MTEFTRTKFDPGVYLVTDSALCGGRGVIETVRAAVAGGISTIQIREKDASAADFYQLVLRTSEAIGDRAVILVNDRIDVYLAARAAGARVHGVHLGQSDLPVAAARAIIGDDAIMGLTANSADHFARVAHLPANTVDYLGVGVIRATATKVDHPTPIGVDGFASIADAVSSPCVAIGGIRLDDVNALRRAGAAGVAVVSALCAAADPELAAQQFVKEWNR